MKRRVLPLLFALVAGSGLWVLARHDFSPARPVAGRESMAPLSPQAPGTRRIEDEVREMLEVPPAPESASQSADPPAEVRDAPNGLARGKLPWEERIERVCADESLSEAAKARQLVSMIPALPEHALTSVAEQIVERLPDRDYNAVGLPILANPQTHGLVASVLFADLMERPDPITLPALLRIARTQGHAYAPFAKDNLNLLLGRDFGDNWLKWEEEISRTLANPK